MEENKWEALRSYCLKYKQTIAVAESVTAGYIQMELSQIKDAEHFFQGGITAYNCGQKARHLAIDPIFSNTCNGVDQQIAVDMAKAACRLFCSQIGLSSTGYATPQPGIRHPFSYFAVVYQNEVFLQGKLIAESKDYGLPVKEEYTRKILQAFSDKLQTPRYKDSV